MQQPPVTGVPEPAGVTEQSAPRFYVTPRRPLSVGVILLAFAIASGVLFGVRYAMSRHSAYAGRHGRGGGSGRAVAGASSVDGSSDDDDDDPDRVDTVYLGDPGEAPSPHRPTGTVSRESRVHPFVVVHLPHTGDRVGLIPDTPSGRLLYAWLAAFNRADGGALRQALPTVATDGATAAQLALRRQTGGFNLVSSKEVQPGVLVFRLRDQTPEANEALGTLVMRPDRSPAVIASFSLQGIEKPPAVPR